MKTLRQLITVAAAALLITAAGAGQTKKSFTFHGKVEAVDATGEKLTVNGEKVEGWMDAMTMAYKVDDPGVLKKVKAGDQITATVYEGDTSLHKIRVTSAKTTGDKKKE